MTLPVEQPAMTLRLLTVAHMTAALNLHKSLYLLSPTTLHDDHLFPFDEVAV